MTPASPRRQGSLDWEIRANHILLLGRGPPDGAAWVRHSTSTRPGEAQSDHKRCASWHGPGSSPATVIHRTSGAFLESEPWPGKLLSSCGSLCGQTTKETSEPLHAEGKPRTTPGAHVARHLSKPDTLQMAPSALRAKASPVPLPGTGS